MKFFRVAMVGVLVAVLSVGLGGTAAADEVKKPEAKKQFAFVGSKKCKGCHLVQHKSWESSAMAKAFDDLKPNAKADARKAAGLDPAKDYTGDPACLSCHTTGYKKAGGFVDLKTTPDLAGVGCESCHGAGAEYLKEGNMTLKNKEHTMASMIAVGVIYPTPKEVCMECHNEKSPFNEKVNAKYKFVFDKATVTKGTHDHPKLKFSHGEIKGLMFQ